MEKAYDKIILSVKNGKSKEFDFGNINPFSFRQQSYRVNRDLSLKGVELPKGHKTYYSVSIDFRKMKIRVTNNFPP